MTISGPATSPTDGADIEAAVRDRRGPLVAIAVVVTLLVAVVAWWTWTSHVTGSVEVAWDGEPTCTGTNLRPDGHTIEARQGMSCVISVTVRNDGPVAVHLDRAVLPFMGPHGGSVLKGAVIDDRELVPSADGRVDAAIVLDHELGSGESWTFRTRIVFRAHGCTAGGRMWFPAWPVVQAEYLGRDRDVGADRKLAAHRWKQNPGCSAE